MSWTNWFDLTDPDVTARMSVMPGNSQGQTTIPQLTDPTQSQQVGSPPGLWGKFVSTAKEVALWPLHTVESAVDVVKNAPANAEHLVETSVSGAIAAATGIGSWTKWVVVGLVAIAVIYLVSTIAPFLPRGRR